MTDPVAPSAFGPSPRTNMLRIALPQLCGALGAAELPCRVFHRLSGSIYLYGSTALDAVTYLHHEAAQYQPKVVEAGILLPCKARVGQAGPQRSLVQPRGTFGERAKRCRLGSAASALSDGGVRAAKWSYCTTL